MGWAALSPISKREVYKGVAEISIYVDSQFANKGYGTALLNELVHQSEENGI